MAGFVPMIGPMDANETRLGASPVSVMMVEDPATTHELLAQFLAASPDFSLVAEASNADDALRLAAEHRPQVVVLDWVMANGTGLKFLREGLGGARPPRVLVVSGTTTDLAVREALSNGAKGYLEKTANFSEFAEAMRAMADGKVYLSGEVAKAVHRMSGRSEPAAMAATLSALELAVLKDLAEGCSSREIGLRLGISVRTVGNHRARLTQKTGLGTIAQLTLHAVRLGLVDGPVPRPESNGELRGT